MYSCKPLTLWYITEVIADYHNHREVPRNTYTTQRDLCDLDKWCDISCTCMMWCKFIPASMCDCVCVCFNISQWMFMARPRNCYTRWPSRCLPNSQTSWFNTIQLVPFIHCVTCSLFILTASALSQAEVIVCPYALVPLLLRSLAISKFKRPATF